MAGMPRLAGIVGVGIALVALASAYILATGDQGRADACLGTTDPIQRGVMVNTCDHPISILACPQATTDGGCVQHSAEGGATFEMRADVAVIAHACRAPYRAVMSSGQERHCQAAE